MRNNRLNLIGLIILLLVSIYTFKHLLYSDITQCDGKGDVGQMVWNLYHSFNKINSGDIASLYETNSIYYPEGTDLAFHTLTPFSALYLVPLSFFYSPPELFSVGMNLIPFISALITSIVCFLIFRGIGFSLLPSLFGAIVYTFSTFFFCHITHLNHQPRYLILICVFLLIKYLQNPRYITAALVGGSFGLSVYFTEFSFYILLASIYSVFKESKY